MPTATTDVASLPAGLGIEAGAQLDHCTDDNLFKIYTIGLGLDIETTGRFKFGRFLGDLCFDVPRVIKFVLENSDTNSL